MPSTELQIVPPKTADKLETFAPRTVNEALTFAELILDSGMAPKAFAKGPVAAIVVAIQYGMEVGLQPMQALQSIAVINGQPTLWGDGALALVMASPNYEWHKEDDFETIKKQQYARCIVKRRGMPQEVSRTFSLEDAKTAGLITKDSPWKTYPARMLQMRARGFALRDVFPDVLKGLMSVEEALDYSGPTIEATTQQQDEREPEKDKTPIGMGEEANLWYKTAKSNGWTTEQVRAWLKDKLNVASSGDIPRHRLPEAMEWAKTKAPENKDAEPVAEKL